MLNSNAQKKQGACSVSAEVTKIIYIDNSSGYFVIETAKNIVTTEDTVDTSPAFNKDALRIQGNAKNIIFDNNLVGQTIECRGTWVVTKYGWQIKANYINLIFQDDNSGIKKYLTSTIKGVGPSLADKIVNHFGNKTLQVLKNNPGELHEIPKINPAYCDKIIAEINFINELNQINKKNLIYQETISFLYSCGLNTSQAKKVYEEFDEKTVNEIQSNPYLLTKIKGIGFLSADKVAKKISIKHDANIRIKAGLTYVLKQYVNNGSCAMPSRYLVEETATLLSLTKDGQIELIKNAIDEELSDENLIDYVYRSEVVIYLPEIYYQECDVAANLYQLTYYQAYEYEVAASALGVPVELREPAWGKQKIEFWEKEIADNVTYYNNIYDNNIKLDEQQKKAIITALTNKITIITGGPGTGKTTITQFIVAMVKDKIGAEIKVSHRDDDDKDIPIDPIDTVNMLLAAPTGKAARRLADATSMPAWTIHKILGYCSETKRFKRNSNNRLVAQFILVDEFSMVNLWLFNCLLDALNDDCSIILVGDVDQLPAIGPGNVLKDLINSGCIAVERLKTNHRQKENLISNIHKINAGEMPVFLPFNNKEEGNKFNKEYGFFFIEEKTSNIPSRIIQTIKDIELEFGFTLQKDIQVMSPIKNSSIGTISLNEILQKEFNHNLPIKETISNIEYSSSENSENTNEKKNIPPKLKLIMPTEEPNEEMKYIQHYNNLFAVGDKVIQIVNDYKLDIMNGKMGIMDSILTANSPTMTYANGIIINFFDKYISYEKEMLEQITLAYALTIHKLQGSECAAVIIPVCREEGRMLYRKLMYTGASRGKNLVVFVGEKSCLWRAIENNREENRLTFLADRIRKEFGLCKESSTKKLILDNKISNNNVGYDGDKQIYISQ